MATDCIQIWLSEVVGGRGPATSGARRMGCGLLPSYARGFDRTRHYMEALQRPSAPRRSPSIDALDPVYFLDSWMEARR
ncbi:hypothetical protein KI387_025504, partial [Taxus chinensis]